MGKTGKGLFIKRADLLTKAYENQYFAIPGDMFQIQLIGDGRCDEHASSSLTALSNLSASSLESVQAPVINNGLGQVINCILTHSLPYIVKIPVAAYHNTFYFRQVSWI